MDKKRTLRSLKLDEGEKYTLQYGSNIYRIEYSSKTYFLDKRKNGKWELVVSKPNRMHLAEYIQ